MNWLKKKAISIAKKSLDNVYRNDGFFSNLFSGGSKHAGIDVNYTTAMKFADVYTSIRIKAESTGQLPMKLYRVDNKGVRSQIHSGRLFDIFTVQPNPYQTWQEFIETYVTTYEILGNFYAYVKRNEYGNVYEIVPFRYQNNVNPDMDLNGNIYYTYSTNDGKGHVETVTYDKRSILHIKANNTDGYRGLSPITQAAQEIGLAIAGTTHAASLFENGGRPSGILSTDSTFGDDSDAVDRLRKQWDSMHGGVNNAGKTAVLEHGMKYQSVQMTSVDAQLLEHSKFSREKIASIFRVPTHMLGAAEGMKYNSIEHNNTGFFRDALMPLVTKLENNLKLFLPSNHAIKLDEKIFVRGDRKTQTETVAAEIKSGLCSLNEGRIDLGREPLEGGDVFAIQTNNLTFGKYEDIAHLRDINIKKLESEAKTAENSANGMVAPSANNPTDEPKEVIK